MRVGGIRISHMSHIDKPTAILLTATRGKKEEVTILPLAVEQATTAKQPVDPLNAAEDMIAKAKTLDELDAVSKRINASDKFNAGQKAALAELASVRISELAKS